MPRPVYCHTIQAVFLEDLPCIKLPQVQNLMDQCLQKFTYELYKAVIRHPVVQESSCTADPLENCPQSDSNVWSLIKFAVNQALKFASTQVQYWKIFRRAKRGRLQSKQVQILWNEMKWNQVQESSIRALRYLRESLQYCYSGARDASVKTCDEISQVPLRRRSMPTNAKPWNLSCLLLVAGHRILHVQIMSLNVNVLVFWRHKSQVEGQPFGTFVSCRCASPIQPWGEWDCSRHKMKCDARSCQSER